MFVELFVLSGLWFWLLLAVLSLFMFAAVNCEYGTGVVLSFAAFFGAWWLAGDLALVLKSHPWSLLYVPALYVAGGFAWSIPRWVIFVINKRKEYNEYLQRFLQNNQVSGTKVPQALWSKWADTADDIYGLYNAGIKFNGTTGELVAPQFNTNKDRLVSWCMGWPWSMLWTLLNDPLRWIYEWFVAHFGRMFQAISDKLFKDV